MHSKEPVVISRLWGGLGGQLFQYAAGFALAEWLGACSVLDPDQCHADVNRPYDLCHFAINARAWTPVERRSYGRLIRLTRPFDATTRFAAVPLKAFSMALLRDRFTYFADLHKGYGQRFENLAGTVYLAGTWASEQYFAHIAEKIRRQNAIREPADGLNAELFARIADCQAAAVYPALFL